jgi:hypothetical protein
MNQATINRIEHEREMNLTLESLTEITINVYEMAKTANDHKTKEDFIRIAKSIALQRDVAQERVKNFILKDELLRG